MPRLVHGGDPDRTAGAVTRASSRLDGVDDGLHADHAVREDERVDAVLDLAGAAGRLPPEVRHVVGERGLRLPLRLRDVLTQTYPLGAVNDAMDDLDAGRPRGRGILVP